MENLNEILKANEISPTPLEKIAEGYTALSAESLDSPVTQPLSFEKANYTPGEIADLRSKVNLHESDVSNLKSIVHHHENMVSLTSPHANDYSLQVNRLSEAKNKLNNAESSLNDARAKLNNAK